MTATHYDVTDYRNAIRLLSSPSFEDRFTASAVEYAEWVIKNDPKSLHDKTYAAQDFAANHQRFDIKFYQDSLDSITFEDYHAERYFHFPLQWITSPDTFREEFLETVAEKTKAADREKAEKEDRLKAARREKYLKLREEFAGGESDGD